MKRAVFKLGTSITIRSTHKGEEPFQVPIDVNDWLQKDPEDEDGRVAWDFDIEPSEPLPNYGVEIDVETLTKESATTFSDPGFEKSLREVIALDYMVPLMHGLMIAVNGKPVEGWSVGLGQGGDFAPMRTEYQDGDVSVEVVAGMLHDPPDTTEPTTRKTDDESGWYVVCNGRVVVAADRTDLTVWGRE